MAIGNNLKMLLGEKLEKLCCFTVNCGFYSKRIVISAQFFIIKLHLCELLWDNLSYAPYLQRHVGLQSQG